MGAINVGARNGGKVKVVAPDSPAIGTEAVLPDHSGTLATIEDVDRITDLGNYMPKAGGMFTGGVGISWKVPGAITESFTVIDNDNNKVVKILNNGSVQTTFKNFKDNDLVTKAYVDKKTDRTSVTCEQNWNNASWNIDNMVDALVSQIKVHNDRTALVLNKNGTDTNIIMDWEKELAPYPSYFGIKIDNKIHYVEVEFTGKGGSNNRGYNFKILDHNLPETVANDTVVGICANYTPDPLTVADYIPPTLHTITSFGETIKYVPLKSLVSSEFSASSADMATNTEFYFWKMYNLEGKNAYAQDFEVTESTMLEIWKGGNLVVKTGIKEWVVYDGADVKATTSLTKPITHSQNLNTNDKYGVIISGLKKKV
jgi:hypothetical protein